MSKQQPKKKTRQTSIKSAASPMPFTVPSRGGYKRQLRYVSFDKAKSFGFMSKLAPLHTKSAHTIIQRPNLVFEDSQGRLIKQMTRMKATGALLPPGTTEKPWVVVDGDGNPVIDPNTNTATIVDKADIVVWEVKEDGTKVPFDYPTKTDELVITGGQIMPEEFAEEYIYEDKVWQIFEVDAKGKATDQLELQKFADELHHGIWERVAEEQGKDATKERKPYVAIIPNLYLVSPRAGNVPEAKFGVVSVNYDENGFSVILRVTNTELDLQRIPYQTYQSTDDKIEKPVESLQELMKK